MGDQKIGAYKGRKTYKKKVYKSDAKQALAMVKSLSARMRPETKFNDGVYSASADWNGAVGIINGQIASGTGLGERVGNTVRAKSILIRGEVILHASASNSTCRLILCYDRRPIAVSLTAADALQTVGNVNAPNSPFKSNNIGRFKVLASKMIGVNDSSSLSVPFKFYHKITDTTQWDTTTGTSLEKNALCLIAISNEALNAPGINYAFRYTYNDV